MNIDRSMIRTITTYLFIFFTCQIGFGQNNYSLSNFYSNDTLKNRVQILSDMYLNTNAFNNQFLHTSFNGKTFSKAGQEKMISRAQFPAAGGGDINQIISYSFKKNNPQINYFISLGSKFHADLSISKDAYLLLFQGNKAFQNKTIEINNTSINWLHYQQLQFGAMHASTTQKTMLGGAISLLNGSNYALLEIDNSSIYTDTLGQSVDIKAKLTNHASDPNHTKLFNQNGLGASADFYFMTYFSLPLFKDSNEAKLTLEVNDFGFITWNKNSRTQEMDTSLIKYEGFDIVSLIKDTNSANIDSLLYFNKSNYRQSFISYLPSWFRMTLSKKVNKQFFTLSVNQRAAANYRTFISLTDEFTIQKNLSASAGISYGGYGKIGVPIQLNLIVKGWNFQVGTWQLEGFILKNYASGNSAWVRVQKDF